MQRLGCDSLGADSGDSRPVLGILLTIAAMVALASADAVAKHLTATYAIVQILWIRYVLYAGYGVYAAYADAGTAGFRSRDMALQVARASLLAISNIVVVYAFSQLPLAHVHAVIAVAPLIVTGACVMFLGEHVEFRRWLAICAGFVGIVIILRPGADVFDLVSLSPLAGALLYATYQVLTKLVTRNDGAGTTQFFTGLIGLLWFSIAVPFVWQDPAAGDWWWLCAAAILGTMAHVLIVLGLHLAPASTVQPFNYSMLVAATVLGYIFFDEIPDGATMSGAAVIVTAGLYVIHRERRALAAA
ncbi:MAG: drug/metabolite transporter (DMT)-like permease [Gammaproteobacteria bacterium]|jgi:drug/metabolite transporter (DMT)-like permease